jgi:hypothetical protein
MITAKKHIPGWAFDPRDEPPPSVAVGSVAELLEVAWIKSWREHPTFRRYSISRRPEFPGAYPLLMVEFDEGREWWVVAYLNDSTLLASLPEWKPVRAET